MRRMRTAFAIALVAVFAFHFTTSSQTPAPAGNRSPSNAEQFDQLFHQVKNWGRWGADDELGAVNLITEANGSRR